MDTDASPYVRGDDRYVVMLAVGYTAKDCVDANPAALAALNLTRDGAEDGTMWLVLDRLSGERLTLEQEDFDPRPDFADL